MHQALGQAMKFGPHPYWDSVSRCGRFAVRAVHDVDVKQVWQHGAMRKSYSLVPAEPKRFAAMNVSGPWNNAFYLGTFQSKSGAEAACARFAKAIASKPRSKA